MERRHSLFITWILLSEFVLWSLSTSAFAMNKSISSRYLTAKKKPSAMLPISPVSAGYSLAETANCSGDYILGANDYDVSLNYVPAVGIRAAFSDIEISDAPADARTTCIDVGFTIYHTFPMDLVVLLGSQAGCEYTLYNQEFELPGLVKRTITNISACNGEPVNQTWTLKAGSFLYGGRIDSWWIKVYYAKVSPPPNDDCNNAIIVQEGVPYTGSTFGATGVGEIISENVNDVNDVWHSFTPTSSGLFTINLYNTNFDTTLAVFDRCGGKQLAYNDDWCDNISSEITMLMTTGNTYLIRVAGYEFEQGYYTLIITSSPPLLPSQPNIQSPANDAANVPLNTVLAWNCTIAQANQEQSSSADTASNNTRKLEAIFGKDDRLDEYEIAEPNILAAGDATVILVPRYLLYNNNDGTSSLPSETFSDWYLDLNGQFLCPDEPFRNQPAPGVCSGFLVASDIITTAGHCACPQDYSNLAIIFGFVMQDVSTAVLRIPQSEIYYCVEVIARQVGDPDWTLIRLDRNVTGHNPLPLRHTGIVANNQPIFVIGHPYGLPRKYAAGANILDNSASAYFLANLDTIEGNSGSAVLNADSLVVEGIVYAGPASFSSLGFCDSSMVCPEKGCLDWPNLEYVTRITEFSPLIPVFDIFLGTNQNQLDLTSSNVVVPWCNSGLLQSNRTYYWKVIAKNCYGETSGPIWSFTTLN